jgi:xylulokinase
MTPGGQNQDAADVYIGLDLGTSGLKAVALTATGAILARAGAAYPTHQPVAGAYEQDPGDWVRAVEQVMARLGEAVPARRCRAIGLSGMLPTLVTLGPDGRPTGPAITWQDARAGELGDEFRERRGAAELYRLTGQWVDGRYLLPMFGRITRADPARAAATAAIASAKDYLFAWLTGELATDPSTAAGYGCYELEGGRWNAATLDLVLPGPLFLPGRLPGLPVVQPSTTIRPLRAEAAARLGCPPVPIVLGAADSVLGALGLGVREPGQVAYIAGTSTVILGIADRLVLDPDHRFLVTPLAVPGYWGLEMDLLATGSAITWLAGLLGGDLDAAGLVELAAGTDPSRAPILLPYLTPGEQGALWDPGLHGAITGLDLGHGREHLARALVNGIVLESRRCLAVLAETCGFGRAPTGGRPPWHPPHGVEVAGRSAAAPSFRTDLADAARRPVSMPRDDDTDHSARGAALIAALATEGGWPHGAFPADSPAAEPDEARAQLWDELWAAHEAARLRLHPRILTWGCAVTRPLLD